MSTTVIDADGHVLEPMEAWKGVPEEYRPRIVPEGGGLDRVLVGDQTIVIASLGRLATPGSKMSDIHSRVSIDEALPGGYDPVERLKDMDSEGIRAAVLFPSVGLNFWAIKDLQAAVVLARAYNDWLAEYCQADPKRFFGAAMVPLQDPKAAAEEMKRAAVELGFTSVFLRPNPCLGRVISDPEHEIIWETAEDLDLTVGIHEGSSLWIDTLGTDRAINPFLLHAVSHSFEQMLALGHLVSAGVMERHPGLRFAFLESMGGWAPFWLERLDEQVDGFGAFCPEMKLKPSEYFQRQCWISFEIDERTLPVLTPVVGEDRIIWGSDYPHHDSTFPGAVDALRKNLSDMGKATQDKILGGNALNLYRLDL